MPLMLFSPLLDGCVKCDFCFTALPTSPSEWQHYTETVYACHKHWYKHCTRYVWCQKSILQRTCGIEAEKPWERVHVQVYKLFLTQDTLLLQEQLLQLVHEERERSQKAVDELIADERIKLQVLLRLFFVKHALDIFSNNYWAFGTCLKIGCIRIWE